MPLAEPFFFIQAIAVQMVVRGVPALAVAVAAWFGSRWARASFVHLAGRTKADASVRMIGGQMVQGIALAVGLLVVLSVLGINESLILATFGTAGIALGLALQEVLKSFFAGLYLLFERPFNPGDDLQIKEHRGRMEHVGFRTTALRRDDDVLVLVPNTVVFSEIVLNRSQTSGQPTLEVSGEVPSPAPRGRRRG